MSAVAFAADREALVIELADAAMSSAGLFPEVLLDKLSQQLDLEAAALFLYTADGTGLQRRAEHGSGDIPESPDVPDDDPILSQAEAPTAIVDVDARAVLLPLHVTAPASATYRGATSDKQPLGVLHLVPRSADPERLTHIGTLLDPLRPYLAKLYLASVERRAMTLRRLVVERVAYRRDIGSMAHNYVTMVKQELCFEGAALWVLDARRNLLYRRRALSPRQPQPSGVTPFLRQSDESLVARTFRTCSPIWHDQRKPMLSEAQVDLACESPFTNWGALPVRLPVDARLAGRVAPAAGVLEFVNHYTDLRGHRFLTRLTWEDQFLADFTCELLSVLIYQILRTQDHESEYERKLHGAKTALLAARSRLQIVERYDVERYMPPQAAHYIANAIDWLQDLESQINRDDLIGRTKSELTAIALYGDVLAKLEVMVAGMNVRGTGNRRLRLSGLDEIAANYHAVPKVTGNRHALDCVFRNLLDNSRKYCRPPSGAAPEVTIKVIMPADRSRVVVLLSDNGAPIASAEAELIFEDGFRGDHAQGIEPEGLGRGLYDCERLMEEMGGSISVISAADGVTFRLELQAARRDRQ
jgi:signal transduction histidine kinase